MSTNTHVGEERLSFTLRALNGIERVGNKLPHPFWLFWVLAVILAGASWILSATDASVVSPVTGETIKVQNLLSWEGLRMALTTAGDNYVGFPPLVLITVVIMGVSIAERTGLLENVMRVSITRVPDCLVVFAVAFTGTMSHVASAAAYVIVVPLGALAFKAVGRSPILGLVVAYTSISSGYDASPIPTPNDAIFAGIATRAAQLIDPDAYVSPLSNWYFNIASSVVLSLIITAVTVLLLEKRTGLTPDSDIDLSDVSTLEVTKEQTVGLRWAGFGFLAIIVGFALILLPHDSPLRGENGSITDSPFLDGIGFIIAMVFGSLGIIYGYKTGSIKTPSDVPALMASGLREMAPILVLYFAISQFLAYFEWTNVGTLMAVSSSDTLRDIGAPLPVIFIVILVILLCVNIAITSGTAMWAMAAPVIIPMLLLLEVPAETTQALYRIADSGSNSVSPMSPYFIMVLGFLRRYRKDAGIGTLASFTLPLAICMTVGWTILFFVWWGFGIPLGPGAPVR